MVVSKRYFHDKLILLLLSVGVFLASLNTILILLRLGNQQTGGGYIVQYHTNTGIGAYKTGGIASILSFILFGLIVIGLHGVLSMKMYKVRRQVSVAILALGILLLVVSIIVSNALLALR